MAKKRKTRKILIAVICVVLVLAIGAGCWFYFGSKPGESVYVYPFSYMGMTEFWGDQQESYGPVSTDQIQTVFLSSTQIVTEVAVSQGDTVKKGDLLMSFDTTLTDIALERERLKVEKLKLDLQNAYKYLAEINAMKPMVIPEPQPEQPEETDPGVAISGSYQLSTQTAFDGSTPETAIICWLASDTAISDSLLGLIHATSLEYREANVLPLEPTPPAEEPTAPTEEPTAPTEETTPPATVDSKLTYVVFKITEDDMSLTETRVWQGVQLTFDPVNGGYDIRLYDAAGFEDHSVVKEEPPAQPEIDFGSGYTAAQIAEMRSQQEKTIRDLQFQVKMAESDYKIKQTEMADGNIYAEIDGTVVSLLSAEEAQTTQQPLIKVSGGGGFYVEGAVSELQKETLLIGQEVTVNDWNTGMVYTGLVEAVADYPLPDDGGMYGNGNPYVSMYPFTVFIDGSADLQSGSYVSVVYSTATSESGIYLENPYLRTENGKSYVYIQGSDGLLEKRYVTTGRSLWGSYTEILEGLSENDLIAFPYGKHVKEGAPTQESDYSTLYG